MVNISIINGFLQKHFGYLATEKNKWFFDVFVFYSVSLFVFAGIYYWVYRRSPDSFAFGSDIATSKRRNIKTPHLADREDFEKLNKLLDEFYKEVDESNEPVICENMEPDYTNGVSMWKSPYPISTLATPNRIYCIETILSVMGHHHYINYIIKDRQNESVIYKKNIKHFFDTLFDPFGLPQNRTEWKLMTNAIKAYASDSLNLYNKHFTEVDIGIVPIWSFWDFLYFSTITQGTVGYGDILPNSTKVRMIVMLQTIITVFLLVVIINVSFSK